MMSPQISHVEVPALPTSEYDLVWNQDPYRANQVKVRSLAGALMPCYCYIKMGKFKKKKKKWVNLDRETHILEDDHLLAKERGLEQILPS